MHSDFSLNSKNVGGETHRYAVQLHRFVWCPCMAINVILRKCTGYDGGLLPDIILLTRGYYHRRGTLLNAMRFLKKNQSL